eukprot:TRINITY_DN28_c1_g1_i1.p1 TRINITY_DN28_c1_g1~~TRINITY_DN28_c1_g1_i1.p1  ORF type:complete len:752 (+),score=71.00 TRINITY_DN28_c1_g1_i1:8417-10672(+)
MDYRHFIHHTHFLLTLTINFARWHHLLCIILHYCNAKSNITSKVKLRITPKESSYHLPPFVPLNCSINILVQHIFQISKNLMRSSRGYNTEDMYKLLIVALRHPEGGHGGESFWCTMLTKYGNRFFGGRSAGSLRDKWRKTIRDRGFELKAYKKELEKDLSEEKIRMIKAEVNGFVPPASMEEELEGSEEDKSRFTSQSVFLSTLQKKLRDNIRREELMYPIPEPEKESSGDDQTLGKEKNISDEEKTDINLEELMPNKKPRQIQRLAEYLDKTFESGEELKRIVQEREEDNKNMVFIHELDTGRLILKNVNQTEEPEECEMYYDIEERIEDIAKKYGAESGDLCKLLAQLSGDFAELEKYLQGEQVPLWTEFEDTVLQHPENISMYKQLEIIKGKEAMKKRREYLQIKQYLLSPKRKDNNHTSVSVMRLQLIKKEMINGNNEPVSSKEIAIHPPPPCTSAASTALQTLLEPNIKGRINFSESTSEIIDALIKSGIEQHIKQACTADNVLDFGDTPLIVSNTQSASADSVFIVPISNMGKLVIEYNECSPEFFIDNLYFGSVVQAQHVTEAQFEETMKNASMLLRPFRGTVARSNFILLLVLTIGLLLVVISSILLGIYVSWDITIGLLVVYLVGTGVYAVIMKKKGNRMLLYAHIALALYAKSETNRLYSKHGIKVRPGFLAKWIEFTAILTQTIHYFIYMRSIASLHQSSKQTPAISNQIDFHVLIVNSVNQYSVSARILPGIPSKRRL